MANILNYNAALDAYNKKPSATSYNNVLNTVQQIKATPQAGGPNPYFNQSGGGGGSAPSGAAAPTGGSGGSGGEIDAGAAAEAALEAAINAAKQQAGDIRNEGQKTFGTILDSINKYRDQNKTDYNNANTDIVNTGNELIGQNAADAQQVGAQANQRARNLGLSDQIRLGNTVQQNLQRTQGSVQATQQSNKNTNQANFNKNEDAAGTQESQANNYLQQINDQANQVENTGYSAGLGTFNNALNNIVNFQRSLAAINPLSAGSIQQTQPNYSGVVNTINGLLSGGNLPGSTVQPASPLTTADTANPVNPTDIQSLLKQHGILQ